MANVSFELPVDIKNIITHYPEINWDKLVQDTLWNYAKKIQLMDKITNKSKLTEENVNNLNKEIKANLLKKYMK